MAIDPIKIVDKEWRDSWKKLRAEMSGKKTFKPATDFARLKRRTLDKPWKRKGVIEQDGTVTKWAPNKASTVARRNRERKRLFGETTGPTRAKEVTMQQRYAGLMVESGDLKGGVRCSWSNKKNQFVLKVLGPASKYAYIHLFGNKANNTPARPWGEWSKEDMDNLEKIILKYLVKVL